MAEVEVPALLTTTTSASKAIRRKNEASAINQRSAKVVDMSGAIRRQYTRFHIPPSGLLAVTLL
jgi:hypothetical protein